MGVATYAKPTMIQLGATLDEYVESCVKSLQLDAFAKPQLEFGHAARYRRYQKGLETILIDCLRRQRWMRSLYTVLLEREDHSLDHLSFDTADDPSRAEKHWHFKSRLDFLHAIAQTYQKSLQDVESENLRSFKVLTAARLSHRIVIDASWRIYTDDLRREQQARVQAEAAHA